MVKHGGGTQHKEPQYSFLKPVTRAAIPNRQAMITNAPFWPEVESILQEAQQTGVAPFKEALELDIDDYKKELEGLKDPVMSVLISLRNRLKKYKLQSSIEVLRRDHRLFLVGVKD